MAQRRSGVSRGRWAGLAAVLLAAAAPSPARAAGTGVDVALVLAVDVSFSMSLRELALQREGYQAALRSPEVMEAIRSGMLGRIGVTYMEWAGPGTQVVVVPWTVINSPASADAFASRIVQQSPIGRYGTSISSALDMAGSLFNENGLDASRRVVDVSGDGPNNMGNPVEPARDALVHQGVTINGLPLMLERNAPDRYSIKDLDRYYSSCVIGGTGAFMIPVRTIEGFEEGVRRKLVQEIAEQEAPLAPTPAAYASDGFDCLIGERLRRNIYRP